MTINRKFALIGIGTITALALYAWIRFFCFISGVVVDIEGKPLAGASVRLQATQYHTKTDEKGRFRMFVLGKSKSQNLAAWKEGYYNWGTPVKDGKRKYRIELTPITIKDNPDYKFITALVKGDDNYLKENFKDVKPCQKCHPEIAEEWKQDAHSKSAVNPVFLAFFNGAKADNAKHGIGYKYDFPNSNGNCGTCHYPVAALKSPFNADPNIIEGVAAEGITCDFCHKIKNARVDRTGGYPGFLSFGFLRPRKGEQIFFGVHDDITSVRRDSYNPLYKESSYCAPCHNGSFWGTLVYSEYVEWEKSSYAKRNITCQNCHMKPTGNLTRFATKESGGIERISSTLASHLQLGIRDVSFMKSSIKMNTSIVRKTKSVEVKVVITNTGAGHHYPTGHPMRNLILLVEATDDNGNALKVSKGGIIPAWGGEGEYNKGNYAGLPGKCFAKIMGGPANYNALFSRSIPGLSSVEPVPHWRPAVVREDTRIPAEASDTSVYSFNVGEGVKEIKVNTRLIYRRVFKNWQNMMGLDLPDMNIAEYNRVIR